MEKDLVSVKRSYGRILLKNEDVLRDFYTLFLNSHPSIPPYFQNTNFKKQTSLLRDAINYSIMMAEKNALAIQRLQEISKSHSRSRLNILPKFYPHWKKTLLATLEKHDPEFSETLKKQWDKILSEACDFMISGHET